MSLVAPFKHDDYLCCLLFCWNISDIKDYLNVKVVHYDVHYNDQVPVQQFLHYVHTSSSKRNHHRPPTLSEEFSQLPGGG